MELWYAIVDLLPFEWAEPGSMYFMKNALLAVLVISPLFGILSTMVVHSRMSFFSDALGHSAFTGMAIGALCGFAEPAWAAVVFAVVFAVLFNVVRRRTAMASDTVIGVFSSTAVALGIFISTLGSRSFTKFNSLLIGDILSVEPSKIGVLALILLLVCALWGLSFNQLMLSAVHPALADSRGVRVFWQETIFSVAIAVVVTLSMTWIGLLVINSLLVLPAAAARNVSRNLFQYHLFSLLGAVLAGIAGLMTSYYVGSSAGAAFFDKTPPVSAELPQIVRTSQKAPADVRIRSFSMRGVAPAAPLQFLVGCAHGCRSEYSGQPSRWPQRR